MSRRIRRVAIMAIAVASVGLLGVFLLSWRRAMAPIEPPNPASFSAESITKGERVAALAHCVSCHTRRDGQPFAGGYGVQTPFGIIYGTNISPDPQTGIGRWSLQAFERAMREGVSRDGSHLFPAFPYYAYTKLWDNDVKVLYAYLMTRPPVKATVPRNTIPFPLSLRFLQEGWKILFFKNGRYLPNPAKSSEWNRGAYLAKGAADCGGCHTPRNALGGEKIRKAYSGALIENWIAPALTEANPSPVPWTQEELFRYQRSGVSALHGATAASMSFVIRDGLALPIVPESDVQAISIYFADINQADAHQHNIDATVRQAVQTSSLGSGQEYDPDASLYAAACMSCHYNREPLPLSARPELALNSALTLPDPTNFIQPVLRGVGSKHGAPGLVMPAYAESLSNADIARLAAYLRRTRTGLPPWTDLGKKVSDIRRELQRAH